MNQMDAMRSFLRVAEFSSFTQAALALGLPKASVSAAVRQLESELGTRLLHRTTRKVQLTQDGQVYYQRCKDLLADLDELQASFQHDAGALTGRLRVDMPSGLASLVVLPGLPAFLEAHPELELELSSTDRRVDLVREGFDCVVRVGAVGDPSLVARTIGHFTVVNCVSRDYAARHGIPQTLEDLAHHRLIHYQQTFGGAPSGFEYCDDEGTDHLLPMAGAVTVNSAPAYTAACIAGLGLVQVPLPPVRSLLQRGDLIEVLPQFRCAPMPISLVYANRRHQPRRVRAFMDWVSEAIANSLSS